MKRLFLMAVLAGLSNVALAEWTRLTSSGDGNDKRIFYVDLATIRQRGDSVKMWVLSDYKTSRINRNGKYYLSAKGQDEYDCREEQSRILTLIRTTGNMGNGDIIYTDSYTGNWDPVVPDSVGEGLLQFACKDWRP